LVPEFGISEPVRGVGMPCFSDNLGFANQSGSAIIAFILNIVYKIPEKGLPGGRKDFRAAGMS
jgi:hypothetical protein